MKNPEKNSVNQWNRVGRYITRTVGLVSLLGNFCGGLFITLYFTFFNDLTPNDINPAKDFLIPGIMFIFLVLIGIRLSRKRSRPLMRYIHLKASNRPAPPALLGTAQRRVLNLPIATSLTSLFNWGLAAIIMSSTVLFDNGFSRVSVEDGLSSLWVFSGIIMGGIATCALIFFLMESLAQKILPYFFPEGGLSEVRGVFRVSLRTRIMVTFVFASIIPMTDLALLSYSKAREMTGADPETVLSNLGLLIIFVLFVDLSLAVILSYLLSKTIIRPVLQMKKAMARVENGDLDTSIMVSDANELGILADHFNRMTEGLRDRYQIKQSLNLARDVQQGLLPENDPDIKGLDIAGRVIYSDETGGDYYDYINSPDPLVPKIDLVVGDVSEHGISSALLMASARAYIRQRLALPGTLANAITDVNFQLSRDIEDSGRFITLFFLSVDYGENKLAWVRAGHEPAIFYDASSDTFEELKGKGIALGVDSGFQYQSYEREGFNKGRIVVIATDGLWEAKNSRGDMFGKKRIRDIIRENKGKSAGKIRDSLLENVEHFQGSKIPEDDITLVVVKSV